MRVTQVQYFSPQRSILAHVVSEEVEDLVTVTLAVTAVAAAETLQVPAVGRVRRTAAQVTGSGSVII